MSICQVGSGPRPVHDVQEVALAERAHCFSRSLATLSGSGLLPALIFPCADSSSAMEKGLHMQGCDPPQLQAPTAARDSSLMGRSAVLSVGIRGIAA